ncbi:sugar transferase [uncultured Parabacteroides sp.]|uniref:sugar transferase n=1 Tax=uncultured Parabacteroides sp. TaxID=512312 RepID=UPI00259B13CC|nr:sugar transferase [uncultured Parabacteroides sp.]
MYKHFFKRLIDFIIAFCVLAVIWPVLLGIALWLHFANKGAGAFFFQERPGKGGKIFKVIKFKTMTDERDSKGELLPNKDRLTPIGKIVRSLSIDELPQFINVLKGDMSLIGPRPLLTWFLPLYDEEQKKRHNVRPGITGWAQVNGRNTLSYSRKFEYDVWYVDNLTFMLDLKIVYMTILNVLSKKDVANGLQHEVDDLGWCEKRKWAEQEYINKYK